jgi:hypothetical protein
MLLTVSDGPAGYEESAAIDAHGLNLATLVNQYEPAIETCLINGRLVAHWQNYVPQKGDRIRLGLKTGLPLAFFVPALSVFWSAVAVTAINTAISVSISMAISAIVKSLTPNPKAPKLDGAAGQAFGITGFTNTTGQGVPIPVWYGAQRVWGHVIASGAELSADHSTMVAKILYCMGDSGGDEYESVSDVLIDRISSTQYNGVLIHTRLGSLTQSLIPEFNATTNLFTDARTLVYNDETESGDPPTIYTTHGNNISRIKLILQFPGGLWRIPDSGQFRADFVELRIEIKRSGQPNEAYLAIPSDIEGKFLWHIEKANRTAFFHEITVDPSCLSESAASQYRFERPEVAVHPYYGSTPARTYEHWIQFGRHQGTIWHSEFSTPDQWDVRITVANAHTGAISDSHATTVVLFNVEEQVFATTNYPGYVLLGITGLQGNQVRNLQSIEVSAFVRGKKTKNPGDPALGLVFSRERTLIVRDMMTHPTVGMGYEFSEAEIDDQQWITDGRLYYDTAVPAQDGGIEQRDYCDVGITERRWDWDWIKRVASEGRACIVPSGLKWKYLVDKPGSPNLLLAEPGNIIEGSISMEIAPPEDPFNQIVGQFRDVASDYMSVLSQPINSITPGSSINQKVTAYETITRESQVLRENMIQMKRQDLERRRWSLVSPSSMLVGEPMDLDWLSERTIGDIGAYAGTLPAGSTQNTLFLPFGIDLEPAKSYLAIVQHKGLSSAETRLISTGAGHWNQLVMATPFAVAPEEGAIFAVGEQSIDHIVTRARDFQIDDQGHITQLRTEYIAEVYNPDPLPPELNKRRFPLSTIPPIPLLDATVINQLVQRKDGSWGSVVLFDVTPGLAVHAGVVRADSIVAAPIEGIPTTGITLDFTEPSIPEQANYYLGAYLMVIDGPLAGIERRIFLYDSPVRMAICEAFPGFPTNGTQYQIRWIQFGETYGFKIEISTDRVYFSELARPVGTHYERDGGDQGGAWWYKFTPYNQNGVFNNFAPILKQVTLSGDAVPPAPPVLVQAWATLRTVTVEAVFQVPTALDFAAIEIQIYHFNFNPDGSRNVFGNPANAIVGTNLALAGQVGAMRGTLDLSNQNPPFGSLMFAIVRADDYSGNVSAWVQSNDFQIQPLAAGDVA